MPAARSSTVSPGCARERRERRLAPLPVLARARSRRSSGRNAARRRRTSRRPRRAPCPGWRETCAHRASPGALGTTTSADDMRRRRRGADALRAGLRWSVMSTLTSAPAERLPHPLVVRTVALDLPGAPSSHPTDGTLPEADPTDLLDLLPAPGRRRQPLAWVRRGDGLVGWGELLRFEVAGSARFADAERAWHDVLAHAIVRDEVRLPGTGPVAFGSFAFDERLPRRRRRRRAAGRRRTTRRARLAHHHDRGRDPRPGAATSPSSSGRRRPRPPPAPSRTPTARSPRTAGATSSPPAIAAIRDGEVDKVVLARDVEARTEHPLDVRWALRRLAQRYPSCWTFSVDGMLGATPELLVRSEKGLVTSRVLAGTIRRTGDDDADLARAAILAHSSKDLEEHEYAVRSVAHALEPFCSSTNVPDVPFVLHLPNVLHLASDVTGVLGGRRATRAPVVARARRGAAPDRRGVRHADARGRDAHRAHRGHGPRTVRGSGRLVRRRRRRRVGHRAALRADLDGRTRTGCGCSPGAASSPRRTPRPSSPSPSAKLVPMRTPSLRLTHPRRRPSGGRSRRGGAVVARPPRTRARTARGPAGRLCADLDRASPRDPGGTGVPRCLGRGQGEPRRERESQSSGQP